jgi:hypothetical protein
VFHPELAIAAAPPSVQSQHSPLEIMEMMTTFANLVANTILLLEPFI